VKRLCEAVGLQVLRLFRPEFGGVTVQGLRPGQFRELTAGEVKAMRQRVESPDERPPLAPGRRLPRAARRHGHGPPPAPGAEAAGKPPRLPRRAPGRGAGGRDR